MPKTVQQTDVADAFEPPPPVKEPWPMQSVLSAIESFFPERSGRLVCKFLWEKDRIARYRANWITGDTGAMSFPYSSFLLIHSEQDGLVIEDGTVVQLKTGAACAKSINKN